MKNEEFGKWFLTRRSMRLYKNHLELTLLVLKIDFFKKDITLTVFDTNNETYAVRVLRYLFQ